MQTCPNCGMESIIKDFIDGCPYCRTHYNVDYTDKHSLEKKTEEDISVDYVQALKDQNSGDNTVKDSGTDTQLNSVYGYNEQNNASPKDTATMTHGKQSKTEFGSAADHTGRTDTDTVHSGHFGSSGAERIQNAFVLVGGVGILLGTTEV